MNNLSMATLIQSVSSLSKIAKQEFKENVIPMTIKRKLPIGEHVTVDIKKAIENWVNEHHGEF